MQSNKYLKEPNIKEFARIGTLLNLYLEEKIINRCLQAWTKIKEVPLYSKLNQITVSKCIPRSAKYKNMISSALVGSPNHEIYDINDEWKRMHTTKDEVKSELTTQSHINQWYNEKTRLKGESLNISNNEDKSTVSKQTCSDFEDDFQNLILEKIERLEEKFQKIKNSQKLKPSNLSEYQSRAPLTPINPSNIPQPKYIKLPKNRTLIHQQTQYQITSQEEELQKNKIPRLNISTNLHKNKPSYQKYQAKTSSRRHVSDLNCSKKSRNHAKMIYRQKENCQGLSFKRRNKGNYCYEQENGNCYEVPRPKYCQYQCLNTQIPSCSCCCGSIYVQNNNLGHSCCSKFPRHSRPQLYKLIPVSSSHYHTSQCFPHKIYEQNMFMYI